MATTIFSQLFPGDVLVFDNVDFVRVNPTIQVTSHPVELGSEVSDHAQTMPLEIQVRGRITETPIIPGAGPELALAFFERNEGRQMTLTTSRGVFVDMFVLAYPWAIEGRREVVFDLVLRRVRFAAAIAVPIPPRLPAPPVADAATAADAGAQPPTTVPPPEDQSVLATLTSFF